MLGQKYNATLKKIMLTMMNILAFFRLSTQAVESVQGIKRGMLQQLIHNDSITKTLAGPFLNFEGIRKLANISLCEFTCQMKKFLIEKITPSLASLITSPPIQVHLS